MLSPRAWARPCPFCEAGVGEPCSGGKTHHARTRPPEVHIPRSWQIAVLKAWFEASRRDKAKGLYGMNPGPLGYTEVEFQGGRLYVITNRTRKRV